MDSPETTLPAPAVPSAAVKSPDVQESPFFTYVSKLSPIKLPDDLCAPSTIRELDFPSPSPVFTSPYTNHLHKDKLLKRCSGSRKFSLDYVGDIREQFEKASDCGSEISQSTFFPCSTVHPRGLKTPVQSFTGPLDCIDDFLTVPVEDSFNSPTLSNLCLSQALPDVSGQCEGSTSLPIVSHQQRDKKTSKFFDNFPDIPAICERGEETKKNDEIEVVESLILASHTSNILEAGTHVVQICDHDADTMDADDNDVKNDEVRMSDIAEYGSQNGKKEGTIIPFGFSVDNTTELMESISKSEMQPKLDAHPEKMTIMSKCQWGACQAAYAMRRRLEFVHSSAPALKLDSSKSSPNLEADITVDQSIPEVKSPVSSLELEIQNASRSQLIKASESAIAYSSPGSSLFQNSLNSSVQEMLKSPTCEEGSLNKSDSLAPRSAGIGLHLNSIGKSLSNNGKVSVIQTGEIDQGKDSDSPTVSFQMGVSVDDDNPNDSCFIDKHEEDQQKNLDVIPPKSQSSLQQSYVNQFTTPVELIEISPVKLSKKTPENDGCKRCNCKKSKCLKLYCDCFAAGAYCNDSCSCQGCLNRVEHKDIVMETRQQIENRNPLAFAPKVVIQDTSAASKTSGDIDKHTPASARHKRGCNCKKSQCLKKYCECFQSKVGCSSGCRCEGCKNTFGRKDGSVNVENELVKTTWNEKYGRGYHAIADEEGAEGDFPKNNLPLHLSPLTPLVDGSTAINPSKSQFLCLKYHSSPDPSASRERKGAAEAEDIETIDGFSTSWNKLGDVFPISPEGAKVNAPLVQQSSPMTPTPRFGQTRFALEFSSSDCGAVAAYEDDNTPDILLREDSMPGNGPRVGSPNKKKRVSPPHHHHQQEEEGSSRSMKSRKFILQSVPSFPSLTPYSNAFKTQPP